MCKRWSNCALCKLQRKRGPDGIVLAEGRGNRCGGRWPAEHLVSPAQSASRRPGHAGKGSVWAALRAGGRCPAGTAGEDRCPRAGGEGATGARHLKASCSHPPGQQRARVRRGSLRALGHQALNLHSIVCGQTVSPRRGRLCGPVTAGRVEPIAPQA